MALVKLTNPEMLKLGEDLVRSMGKQRLAIEAIEAARGLIPSIERANRGLIATQVPGSTELAALGEQLKAGDERHDALVRAIDGRLAAEYEATTDGAVRQRLTKLQSALFPSGRGIIQRSYLEEAGEVSLRAARVTENDRKVLRKLKTYEGRTLDELFTELQSTGREIGALENRRKELSAEGESIVQNRAARFQWIRAIHALAAVLDSEGIDPTSILGAIRDAEASADRRAARGQGEPEGEDGSESEPEDGEGEDAEEPDPELDPPVPADDDTPDDT